MATRKKTAARPILSLDDLDAAGIGLGWQPMVPAQEVAPVAPVEPEQDGPMARGVKQVSASVGLAGRLAARDFDGAAKNISDQAAYRAANPGSEEAQGLRSAWQQGDGIWGGIKAVAGEFADDYKRADGVGAGVMSVGRNLQAMGSSLVEQVPNMALPMAGMIGGGAAGSAAAGPIGTVAGGWAGASAGNALVGTSEAAFRQLEKAGVNPTDAAAVREYLAKNGDAILGETAIKGGVIGAVDVATAGLAHWLLSGPGKMATTKALTEMGVDMADKAAVKAATKTPVFKNLIANDATYQATQVGAQKLLRNTGAAATEPVGEFAGEYGGSLAATGEADAKDAFLEAASSLGQSGIMFAGQKAIQAIKSPSQAAADQIRATEKVPESGALTRAVNTGVEAKAQAIEAGAPLVDEQAIAEPEPVDDPVRDQILALPDGARQDALRAYAVVNRTDVAKGVQQYNRKLLDRLLAENAPPPVLGERLTDTDMGSMLGGGGMAGRADPLVGALGMNNEAQANSITNVANVAERRPPMPASDALRMLDEARNRGLDLAVVEHPSGGFVLIPPTWVTPDMAAQGEARLNETIARMQQADAAPVERTPRTRTDGVGLNLQTDPVQNYLDNLRSVNTPAARAYVRDFDAGRITPADVQQRMQAERGLTPEQRIARAAAEAPAQVDTVAERLRSAAAQGMATPAPTDILNPSGEPFKTKMAADLAAKKTPGAAVLPVVDGGFLVRPQEPVNVQDVPQAPEVPQAAPAVSQPDQTTQAVGAQPAGPAAGVPAEGAGAVEAAGVNASNYKSAVDEWNAKVQKFKAATTAEQEEMRPAMEAESARMEKARQSAMKQAHAEFERQQSELREKERVEKSAKYGAMPIGTRIGIIGHEKDDSAYWEKTGQNEWTRNGIGSEKPTRSSAEMEGGRIVSPADTAPITVTVAEQSGEKQSAAPAAGAPEAAKSVAQAGDADAIAALIQQSIVENSIKANEKIFREKVAKGYLTQEQADADLQRIREGLANTKPNQRAQSLAKAIAEKDPRPLVGAWAKEGQGTYGVEGSMAGFEKATGVKLRRLNSADRAKAIFDWAGWTEDQVAADVAERRKLKAESDAAREAKWQAEYDDRITERATKELVLIKDTQQKLPIKEYVDGLISQGYNTIRSLKRGAITKTYLANERGAGYPLPVGVMRDYAQAAVRRAAAPNTGVEPANTGVEAPAQETTHNGTRIYPTKIKVGDEVKSMWAVESPDNQRRRAAGERTIGGDSLHDSIEQAKAAAEREAKRDAAQQAAKAEQDAADKARLDAEEARKAANRPKTVVERRKDAILDGPSKIGQGTKRAVITSAVDNGYVIEAKMVYDHAAKKRDQEAVDRASRAGYILGVSNENLPLVKAGNEAKARLKEGKYEKPEYRVYQGSDTKAPFREITKTEYDYAQELKAQRAAAQQAEAAQPATPQQATDDFLPEGWTKSVNGYTKRPVYRMEQGGGQPFAVVTQVDGMQYEVQIRHGSKQLTVSNQTGALSEVLAKAEAELTRMTQADSVTHQDLGEKAEAATPGVVTDSLKKAARNEDTKPSEMRKWLVAEIDKELLQAADRPDYDEAVKRMGEKDAISMFTGNGPLGKNNETGYVTFDVPGDGKYKVRNSVRGLLEFRKNVMASQGFKDSGQKRAKPDQNDGVQGGSGGNMAAITNMIEEGDFEAARDYAEAVGIARLFVSKTPKNRNALYAEQDGKLREVTYLTAEQKAQWDRFMSDGTLPTPPDTKPQTAPKTAAQEVGPFGPILTQYRGDAQGAIQALTELKDGEAVAALNHPDVGDIDLVWGEAGTGNKDGFGLSKLIKYHPEVLGDLQGFLAKLKKDPKRSGENRVRLVSAGGEAAVSLNWQGDRKVWLLTAYEKSAGDGTTMNTADVANRDDTTRPDASAEPSVPRPPDGYKPAGEPFYRGGKQIQGYAPFAPGERVTMKDSAGQSGVIESLASPDDSGVFASAVVKFDNGVEQMVQFGKLEAAAPQADTPKLTQATGARRDPTKVSMFSPYEDGDIVTIDGQDWAVKQDTPGWYLTNTGNWRGTHPTIRNIKAMADLIREVEQASVARKAAAAQPEAPKLTPAEAKSLMEWQDLGQKDGVKTHALTFYESQADKDAKRGRMIVAKVSKGDRSATAWMVDGEDKTFGALAQAKKLAEEVGMAKAVADGFVEQGAEAPKSTEKPAAPATTSASIEDAGEKIGGARKDRWKERGLNLDDLDAMTEAEGAELATKANVWKPDYEALAAQSEPVSAAMTKVIYDRLAAKPKKNTPEGRRQYVQMMRIVRDVLTEAKGPDAVRNAYLEIRNRAGLNTKDPQAKAAARELLFSVYKGRSDPFVLDGGDLMKVKKMVTDGFPAKGDPWKTRLTVGRAEGGAGTTERGIEIYMERSAEVGTPLTREQILDGFYRVSTKDNKTVAFAASKADAEAAAATVYERDMKGKKDGKPEPVRPNLDELKRENLPQRIDRDVTSEDFVRDLGFRGVEFGNWSAQDERQRILNMAYDGLMDLAEIMGVPPKAMSLNGTLGMAFGARGGGRFAAHYEPGKLVINMTKIRGGGSMAHEWAHAMDHYFGELDKPDAYTTQARGASGWYSEDQYNGVPRKRMERVGNEWKNVEKMRLDNLRPEMAAAFDEVMRALFQKQITKAEMVRSHELDLERTQALARNEQDAELKAMYQNMVTNKRQALDELRKDPDDKMYAGRGRTDYANQAQALSGKSVDGYWVRPTEMFARAFESWVFDRVTAMGARSDYLVHGVEEDRFAGGGYKGNPYPTGEERARINAAFDKLASTIKTKETDKGVAMFSRSPSTQSAYEARIDALFAGEKAAGPNRGARVLDRSDVLGLLGFGDGPVNLAEGKVIKGQENHPRMTAEQWKKVPEWLDNPAAVFDSDTVPGALVLIAPETINGATVRMTVEPRKDGGADVHILTNAYDAPGFTPFARWFREGLGRLVDQKKFPAVLGDSGLQLSSSTWQNKPGMPKILTEKHLDGYRRANNPAAFMGQPTPPADSNARNVATQQLVDGLKAKWTRAPEIIVARNMQDAQIPQEVRDYDALLKSQGATGEPRGFIYKGKVYLLSDQLKGPQQIAEVLFHEVLGHYGLRGAFGDGLTPILKQLGALRRKDVVAKAREYGLFNKDALGGLDKAAASDSQIWAAMSNKQRLDAAEEVLAEMAQTKPELGYVKRAISAIRNWLRANVPGFKNLKLTDADIVQAYILPARAYVTRSNETVQQAIDRAMADAGFSRTAGSDSAGPKTEISRRNFLVGVAAALASNGANASTVLGKAEPVPASILEQRLPVDLERLLVGNGHGTTNLNGSPVLRQVLQSIAESGPKEVRALAAKIAALVPERGLAIQVDKGDWNAHGAVELSPIVRLRLFDGKTSTGMDYGTLLHEALHVAVAARYKTLSMGVVRANDAKLDLVAPNAAQALEQFRQVWDEFAKVATPAARRAPKDSDLALSLREAIGDPDEFFVRALTDPTLQKWMAANEYEGKTLLARFKDWVKSTLFGKSGTRASWLDAALAASDDVLQAMSSDSADFSRLKAINQYKPKRSAVAGTDVNFSRTTQAAKAVGDAIKSVTVTNIKQRAGFKLTDYLGIGLQALGRRQIVDIYGDLLPLAEYNRLVQQMEADKNEGGAEADQLVTRWAKLDDEGKLADLMHDATLAQIDPAEDFVEGDDKGKYLELQRKYILLSDEAKNVYADTRDSYKAHHAKVRSAIKERIERSEIKGERKAALLKQMDDEFFKAIKGVYFPLARFGQYAVTVKGSDGKVESVSRAETKAEAEALRNNLLTAFPRDKGFTVGRVMLSKDFIADRDAVGRGFMTELYQVLDKQDMDAAQRAELEDTLGQLYLSSLPDLSWAKHGIHRKGTPGFSQDARRAFAQNMFHGARYLAKLRYSDLMQDELTAMQRHVDDWREVEDFDQNSAQRVVDEMNKRHESLMNPKSNPLSTALTSLGFVFHLGLSPASAMVNLSQTALVAYPIMGAKWGFGKASAALLKASAEAAKGKNDITASLNTDELAAYNEAVRAGTIDVTMAHDLAGIAQGEDAGVMWKIRPVMRWASFLFHHAERFNRQVTFVAAYRLAREAGADHKAAFEQATKATYDGHFDYGAANRPRIMQGNVAKVLLLFKQYGQNMVYTLARNAQQAIKGESPEVRAQARKALGGLLATHAMAAGVLGLPMVTTLLAAASMIGGDDDEPWDAKVALQNMLADTLGQKPAEVLAHGLSRLTPWDISGRVGLDKLIFPDVQEGLEGQRLGEAAMAAALGPVAGIGINVLRGLQDMSQGQYARGLESMMPAALRGPIKAIRYESEGVQDKTGVVIKDDVSLAGVAGQFLGFSPSEVRNATEGKSAVIQQDRALGERRQELLTKAARATMAKDAEARAEAMKEIERFNQKNPTRRITPLNVLQSVRNRQKRIDQAEGGVYLPKNRRDAMEAGRFAVVE